MLNDPKHPRPKRTPPHRPPYLPPLDGGIAWDAVDAALEADIADDHDFAFRCFKLFGNKKILVEPDIGVSRSPDSVGVSRSGDRFSLSIDTLFRLYYEFQRLQMTPQDAGDMAIRTFLTYY